MDENFKYFYIPKVREAYSKKFWITSEVQNFSIPKPIIDYLWKNIESPNVYQNLLESCKYFYSKKFYLLLQRVYNSTPGDWVLEYYKASRPGYTGFDVRNYDGKKIWLTGKFEMCDFDNFNITSEVMTKIYRCDIQKLVLWYQNLLFKDFCVLSAKVQECKFFSCLILNEEDNEEVPFEKVFECFHNIRRLCYSFPVDTSSFTFVTMQKIIELPNFQKIDKFGLHFIPLNFDVLFFYNMIKETKSYKKIVLRFCEGMPDDFKNQITKINYEILKNSKLDFVPPFLIFPEMNPYICSDLRDLQSLKFKRYNPAAYYAEMPEIQNFAASVDESAQWLLTSVQLFFKTLWYKHFQP